MKRKIKYLSFLVSMAIAGNAMAYHEPSGSKSGKKGNEGASPVAAKGAGCAPASARLTMSFNDVSAQLESGGLLFLDRQNNIATYRVPKSGNVTSIYAGSLWMGGVDVNGQLKLAAVTYRQDGNDFWAGPLTVIPETGNYDPSVPQGDTTVRDHGEGNITAERCLFYDRIFTIRKAEVIAYIQWWECNAGVIAVPAYCAGGTFDQPNAEVLSRIYAWPGNGNQQDFLEDDFLAPFYDRDLGSGPDGIYDPVAQGDYPWYDDILERDDIQCGFDRRLSLFGDETHWWVFNDRGNIHTETGGDAIGMEIRAQAFAFATDDEINRMTFYNYELINRGSQTLDNTFFAQYIDADLGGHLDDYVGCDVSRGLGYTYNGELIDGPTTNSPGYGANPPAIGVDFFEGPYQDADGVDNPIVANTLDAIAAGGIVYPGLGIGYGDSIIDNERFGMRRFCYYTGQGTSNQAVSDPTAAVQYYNYMKGNWRFGDEMYYGGSGHSSGGATTIPADYMFPGDSDSLNWSTQGTSVPYENWSEFEPTGAGSAANPPGDRRFVQAAGPFVLRPGAVNNITVGIVYARSAEGDVLASVRALKRADTKAQALFDNCFRILEPPNAPELKIQELENELILTLDNPSGNNINESYQEEDNINIPPDPGVDRFYRFEGYQIFQMRDASSTVADLGDFTKARLVAQCDVENGVTRLVNFEFDEELGFSYPVEKVDGADDGIKHSFRITEDVFASGVRTLVNHKTYYYIAVAYGYNNFKKYDPNDPLYLDGQRLPYLRSRINADGSAIAAVGGVPHDPSVELGGTQFPASYGQTPRITRVDGVGNGGRALTLTSASENNIVANGFMEKPEYEYGGGPINVKVIDPLNLQGGYFELKFRDYTSGDIDDNAIDSSSWIVYRYVGGVIQDSVTSDVTIQQGNEQLVPEWGVSIEIKQDAYNLEGNNTSDDEQYAEVISSSLTYGDSTKQWLSFVQDDDLYYPTNWIRDGSYEAPDADCNEELGYLNPCYYKDEVGIAPDGMFSSILGGGVAPHRLTGYQGPFMPLAYPYAGFNLARQQSRLSYLPSVDIVLTSDKSKWTRCVVIELGFDQALNVNNGQRGKLRQSPSVDKNGNPDGSGTMGQSWFPGYAIDLETGARLHMAFGENSFLGGHNGSDMMWNPTDTEIDANGVPVFGGQHPIWVFGYNIGSSGSPYYTEGNTWVYDRYMEATNTSYGRIVRSLMWIANVYKTPGHGLLESEARIGVRMAKEYFDFNASGENGGKPMYSWSMDDISSSYGSTRALEAALDKINVVPNPYYAYSEYERNRIDNRVKIVNLPDQCTVNIYNTSGKLIRTFKKDNQVTSIDWDLKNAKGIPIASGVYLIHVEVPGVGEKVVKFFGGMRQIDLQNI
jgi:hypothetical protein